MKTSEKESCETPYVKVLGKLKSAGFNLNKKRHGRLLLDFRVSVNMPINRLNKVLHLTRFGSSPEFEKILTTNAFNKYNKRKGQVKFVWDL